MTFLEAAIEVLRREGKALHFKELTRLAIKYDLLSVVGRDPEQMMQTRLQAEVRRPTSELTRVSPGVFGLRNPPARPSRSEATKPPREPAAAAAAGGAPAAEAPASAPAAEGGGRGRRRRDRGPAKPAAAPAAAAEPATEAATPPAEPAAAPAAAELAAAAPAAPDAGAAPAPAGPARERDRDRGRGGRRRRGDRRGGAGEEAADTTAETAPAQLALAPAAAPAPAAPAPASLAEPESAPPAPSAPAPASPPPLESKPRDSQATPVPPPAPAPAPAHVHPHPRTEGPALIPVAAGEPVVLPPPSARTPQPPAAESPLPPPPKSAMTPVPAPTPSAVLPPPPPLAPPGPNNRSGAPQQGQNQGQSQGQNQGQGQLGEANGSPRVMSFADAAYDVLRGSSDGRPIHFRQIAEIAIKRRLLRGDVADVARAMRGALVREQRQRDSDGLRPRIRNMGQGQFALGERKLEPELYGAERDMLDRVNRTREATRVALRRRLRVMPPGPFELLMRLLMEKLGVVGAELIKRGEGVAYYAGTYSRGSRNVKVLCAIRPGETEVSREAVGELRAGVRLRSYDEGLMLCGGRLSSNALAEANAQPGIDAYDQDALTDLLVRFQLGVRRMLVPIDYLDTELFNELLDQS